jgi:hypothetical protein
VSSSDIDQATSHDGEQHSTDVASRLNWLRAGVLGANDGIVSTAGLVVGVAGATTDRGTILTAGWPGWSLERCRWPPASTSR